MKQLVNRGSRSSIQIERTVVLVPSVGRRAWAGVMTKYTERVHRIRGSNLETFHMCVVWVVKRFKLGIILRK